MSLVLGPPGWTGVALLIFRREVTAKLASPWLYCVASTACLIAWLYGAGFAQTFATESVLVTTDPLMSLNIVVVVFLGLVLGLRLSSSIAWEREHETLEVLLAGPVSMEAVMAGKFLVELCIFTVLIAIYFLYLLAAQPLGPGVIGFADVLSAGRLPLHALPVLALGMLVSAWSRTVRSAVVVYLVLIGFLSLFEIALGMLLARSPEELSLAAIYLRATLQGAAWLVQPMSAMSRIGDLVEGVTVQAPVGGIRTAFAVVLTAATLAIAVPVSRLRRAA